MTRIMAASVIPARGPLRQHMVVHWDGQRIVSQCDPHEMYGNRPIAFTTQRAAQETFALNPDSDLSRIGPLVMGYTLSDVVVLDDIRAWAAPTHPAIDSAEMGEMFLTKMMRGPLNDAQMVNRPFIGSVEYNIRKRLWSDESILVQLEHARECDRFYRYADKKWCAVAAKEGLLTPARLTYEGFEFDLPTPTHKAVLVVTTPEGHTRLAGGPSRDVEVKRGGVGVIAPKPEDIVDGAQFWAVPFPAPRRTPREWAARQGTHEPPLYLRLLMG